MVVCVCVCGVAAGVSSAAHKGNRPHIAFKYNLFEHLGDISSLRATKSPVYAKCYEPNLDPGVLFKVGVITGTTRACPDRVRVSLTEAPCAPGGVVQTRGVPSHRYLALPASRLAQAQQPNH